MIQVRQEDEFQRPTTNVILEELFKLNLQILLLPNRLQAQDGRIVRGVHTTNRKTPQALRREGLTVDPLLREAIHHQEARLEEVLVEAPLEEDSN